MLRRHPRGNANERGNGGVCPGLGSHAAAAPAWRRGHVPGGVAMRLVSYAVAALAMHATAIGGPQVAAASAAGASGASGPGSSAGQQPEEQSTGTVAAEVLLSGLFACLVAVGVTVGIERLGGVAGGVLGTVPTTVVPVSIGLYYRVDTTAFQAAMFTIPVGMLVDGCFLLVWRHLPPRLSHRRSVKSRLAIVTCTSLSVWLVMSLLALGIISGMRAAIGEGGVTLMGILGLLGSITVGGRACLDPPDAPRGDNKVAPSVLVLRGLFAGSAIAFTVLIAAAWDLAAGVISVFPSIFLTTMLAVSLAQGEAVSAGAIGPMVLGSTAVSMYAVLFAALAPALGPWGGALLVWPLAVGLTSVPVYTFIEWRRNLRYQALKPDLDEFDDALDDDDVYDEDGSLNLFAASRTPSKVLRAGTGAAGGGGLDGNGGDAGASGEAGDGGDDLDDIDLAEGGATANGATPRL